MKFDGYPALAFKVGKEVRLISRSRTNFDSDYPRLIGWNRFAFLTGCRTT
jgi:hypothetical protein